MDVFFYSVMMGDETFFNVYRQILDICMVKDLSFTKEDIDEMPPFERMGYVEMIKEHLEEQENKAKQESLKVAK